MEKGFVFPSTSRYVRCGFLFDIRHIFCETPVVVVEASDNSKRMIDGTIGACLFYGLNRQNFERTRGQLEPQHKLGEVISRDLLPVKMLLS